MDHSKATLESASSKSNATFPAISPEQRKQILLEGLIQASAARDRDTPEWPQSWPEKAKTSHDSWGDHFLSSASRINSDLALAAEMESNDDVYDDDGDMFSLFTSPVYRSLQQWFIEAAADGDEYAFCKLVWRCWNAGRVSPDRLVPRSEADRHAERVRRDLSTLQAIAKGNDCQSKRDAEPGKASPQSADLDAA